MAERQREYADLWMRSAPLKHSALQSISPGHADHTDDCKLLSTEQMFSMATIFAGVRAVRWAVQPQKGDVCMLPAAMAFLLAVKPALHCVLKSAKE